MPARHSPVRIGHARMQMRTVSRHRTGQREKFEIPVKGVQLILPGEAQARLPKAPDPGQYERRATPVLEDGCLQRTAQIGARL